MKPIALTGGIACGKSQASRYFNELGIQSVDADDVARDLLSPGSPLLTTISDTFGPDAVLPSGEYNRPYMRNRVFNDPGARQRLNALVHPAVQIETQRRLAKVTSPYALWVIPLLIETEQTDKAEKIVVVDVPESVQIERMRQRDGRTETEARQALAAQATRPQRLAVADFVIDNTGSLAELKAQVQTIHEQLMNCYDAPTG